MSDFETVCAEPPAEKQRKPRTTPSDTDGNALSRSSSSKPLSLAPWKDPVAHRWEIGVDEAGRGPLFGRLYVAAAVVPKDVKVAVQPPSLLPKISSPTLDSDANPNPFRYDWLKDSKKFTSEKKIAAVADHIKANAPFWTIRFAEPALIDELNIRQATLRLMRECCLAVIDQIRAHELAVNGYVLDVAKDVYLLVDGNDFPIMTVLDEERGVSVPVQNETVEQGDNKFCAIAAASILAKVERDKWIYDVCDADPSLDERYGLRKNKGYGTKKHMEGLREFGRTEMHRQSFKFT